MFNIIGTQGLLSNTEKKWIQHSQREQIIHVWFSVYVMYSTTILFKAYILRTVCKILIVDLTNSLIFLCI